MFSYEEVLNSPEMAQLDPYVLRIIMKSIPTCDLSGVPVTLDSTIVLLWAMPDEPGVKIVVIHARLWDTIASLVLETSRSGIKFRVIDSRKVG